MAKRVVVFEKAEAAPSVVVRRKGDAGGAKPQKNPATAGKAPAGAGAQASAAESGKAPKTQGRRDVTFTAPKIIAKGARKPGDAAQAKGARQPKTAQKTKPAPLDAFRNAYLAELGRALVNARGLLADASGENKEYYQDKSAFLAKLADYFDNGAHPEFTALDEPFFWFEFFVISMLLNKKRPENCGKNRWDKQANAIIKIVLEFYNGVRAKRDNYVLRRYPKWENDVIFNFCGTMLYLKKSMAEAENGDDLGRLLARYKTLSAESGIGKRVLRMAAKLRQMKAREGFDGWKLWNNQETVEYVYNLAPEQQEKPGTEAKGGE